MGSNSQPLTKENKAKETYHEPSQDVSQHEPSQDVSHHSRHWLWIVVALISVAVLVTGLVINRWRHPKKNKGEEFRCLAAEEFIYIRLFGKHGMGYVTFDVRMST